jgi:2-isopropylmalate synthase
MVGPSGREPSTEELIFDWNEVERKGRLFQAGVSFFDETLRDGLQNASGRDPDIGRKLELLHLMDRLGIQVANVGLPGSCQRAFDDCLRLCQEMVSAKLRIRPACAARTLEADITPIIEISAQAGLPVEIYAFIPSSPIRHYAENLDIGTVLKRSARAIDLGIDAGLPVAYVTEDTTRARPEVLRTLFEMAVDHGASRVCLADTVGHATPDGVRNLIRFTRTTLNATGAQVGIDWHGHNDRGFALENAIWALEFGADRVHATALGLGERAGNAPMELLLLNLKLLGVLGDQDLTGLLEYCERAADAVGWDVPINYPLVGRDAFRTATGVHAAAILKAEAKGDAWLADRVYSGVPAGMFGRSQEICIGYLSGASNVKYWLRKHGIPERPGLVDAILNKAKAAKHILPEEEIRSVVDAQR